jgi:hypothetical protein
MTLSLSTKHAAAMHYGAGRMLADTAFLEFADVDHDLDAEFVSRQLDAAMLAMLAGVDEVSKHSGVTDDQELEFYHTCALRGFETRWAELCHSAVPGGRT